MYKIVMVSTGDPGSGRLEIKYLINCKTKRKFWVSSAGKWHSKWQPNYYPSDVFYVV